ncbi:MAG: hypothetical protein ABUS48_02515 [Pseudomonadota bacterium]
MRYRIQYAKGPREAPLSVPVDNPIEYIDAANHAAAGIHARNEYARRGANGYTLFQAGGDTVLGVWDKWANA